MIQSADIRRDNKHSIYKIMQDGDYYTKQQISNLTGLSVATCNTLLNEMFDRNYLMVNEEKELRGIGRGSSRFCINPNHESHMLVNITIRNNTRIITLEQVNARGETESSISYQAEYIDVCKLFRELQEWKQNCVNPGQIIISVPAVIDNSEIRYCDIPELNGLKPAETLKTDLDCPVRVYNDMHMAAYGFPESHNSTAVITLGTFMRNLYPGTVTMHKGQIISGANGIAGLAGFLPFGFPMEELPSHMNESQSMPIMEAIIGAAIAFLNPDTMVLSGDLINEDILLELHNHLAEKIPASFLPKMIRASGLDDHIRKGMFRMAIEHKVF